MTKKQTSVEWLWEQLDNTIPFQHIQTSQIFDGLLDQAKAMHKEEIIDAHDMGYIDGGNHKKVTAEQYYNETFKSE